MSDTPYAPPPSTREPRRALPLALAVVALALLAAGVVTVLDMRHAQRKLAADVADKLAASSAATARVVAQQSEILSALHDAQAKGALLDARIAEMQSREEALETLYRDIAPTRDDLALAEIEESVNVAVQQLALAGNVQAALVALQLADAKLARLDRPRFAPLRRALAADMDRLKKVPSLDVPGLTARIDSVIAAIDTLPLARDARLKPAVAATPAPANAVAPRKGTAKTTPRPVEVPPPQLDAPPVDPRPPWRRWLDDMLARMHDIVRIQSTAAPAPPLLLPSEEYFLRENLRLRLLSARNALIARNDASFKADIRAATLWINKYFDTQSRPVQGVDATLADLAGVAMPGSLPDLAPTLSALAALTKTPR
ncbi:MAG: uroporphyrinogen-III C-methyltransferase [Proteobacteria bacterium]|nr:uroporphyrinogen-III C-methyltransferase [Pseudomonadota bacterium]